MEPISVLVYSPISEPISVSGSYKIWFGKFYVDQWPSILQICIPRQRNVKC